MDGEEAASAELKSLWPARHPTAGLPPPSSCFPLFDNLTGSRNQSFVFIGWQDDGILQSNKYKRLAFLLRHVLWNVKPSIRKSFNESFYQQIKNGLHVSASFLGGIFQAQLAAQV
jgi:hypothetical protein